MTYNYPNIAYPQVPYYPQYQPQIQQQVPMMQQTAQQTAPVQQASPAQTPSTIIWVNGEKEAALYPVTSNSAVALWDSANPVIYLKQADASGKPTMRTYDLVERVEVTRDAAQIDPSVIVTKADLASLVSVVGAMQGDIDKIKEEMGNLASQAVKRAVGAKPKKEPVNDDDD